MKKILTLLFILFSFNVSDIFSQNKTSFFNTNWLKTTVTIEVKIKN